MHFDQRQTQSLKQIQRLIMSPQMQQALHLMQLPVLELSTMIEAELEQNPVLDLLEEKPEEENAETPQDQDAPTEEELSFDDQDFEVLKRLDDDFRDYYLDSANYNTKRSAEEEKKKLFQETQIQSEPSLYGHLMSQAADSLEENQMKIAEVVIGNFNESGFLEVPIEEIARTNGFSEKRIYEVLETIQTFEPFGVGARSLQESMLIQLRCLAKKNTLAYKIIENHYEDLLYNRIPNIKKELGCTFDEIREAIDQQISKLDLHPGTWYSQKGVQFITADLSIKEENDQLVVVINNDYMPSLRLNRRYLNMLEDETLPKHTKDFIKHKVVSAKWLLKNIDQRNDTLERVGYAIAKRQKDFFLDPKGKLSPLTMKVLAEELSLNESTIARAVANKYVDTPRGLLPLRYFFSNAYTTTHGEDISSKTVRDVLQKLIDREDKKKPLSDETLSRLLKEKGIACARRTIAKYRTEMKIGNASQRKEFS